MELGKRSGRIIASAMMLAFFPGAATAASFGKENEKINLVVGYQPYYTEAWSGVVNNGKKFWKKYLPEGSTASFQVGLQGAVIVNSMTGEKQHIGYVGDMPGIVATFQSEPSRGGTDIRIVGVLGTSKQQCNVFLVRNEAPEFKSGREAVAWMDEKIVALPQGSCTDRFARLAFEKASIKPYRYLNQNIEVITSNFRVGKLDAAVVWEPTASKIEQMGLARRASSGEDFNVIDGGLLIMLNDLIEQRPDVVRAWMESELESQLFLADLANASEVIDMVEAQTEKIDRATIWNALYGASPSEQGGGEVKLQLDFVVNERVRTLIDDATAFLHSLPSKPASSPTIRANSVDDSIARQVLEDRGLASPVGLIKAQPVTSAGNY
ncbi:nitrate ABC transporter substrate-binding protein [Hyphomicrobium sp.]|uniref:nitrate ABC transporter substrate-binding protein n=1 Tax=Hyphomicrobium sp. TaxID=82 RepID=UPI002FDDBE49